jgi:glycosyltransferase involved in cell wall biosynthesis
MRILYVAHQFFPEHYAGVEVLTLGLAKEAKFRGHETFVLAAKRSIPGNNIEPGQTQDYEFEGVPVRRVGRPTEGLSRPYRLDYENETMARRTREYMRDINPDVAHALHFQGLSASVIPVFKEFDVPLVYTATDFWAVCPVVDLRRHDGATCKGPELHHCVRCIASRYPGTQMKDMLDKTPNAVIRAAGTLSKTPLSRLSHSLRQVGAVQERPEYIREKMELIDEIIAPTKLTRDLLHANGVGAGKIQVSHYGIDTSNIEEASRDHNVPPPLRVGFIGTLAPHKGCDVLIQAFKSLPKLDARLSIHANLERKKAYVQGLRRIVGNDPRINFAGPFTRDRLGEVMSEVDVLVVPSRWYENAPVVIYEAFAAKTPVIATDLGGMSEVVEHEKNGLLFELENVQDLARQLQRLAGEPGLLDRLREGIGPVKTVEDSMDEMEQLYKELGKVRQT